MKKPCCVLLLIFLCSGCIARDRVGRKPAPKNTLYVQPLFSNPEVPVQETISSAEVLGGGLYFTLKEIFLDNQSSRLSLMKWRPESKDLTMPNVLQEQSTWVTGVFRTGGEIYSAGISPFWSSDKGLRAKFRLKRSRVENGNWVHEDWEQDRTLMADVYSRGEFLAPQQGAKRREGAREIYESYFFAPTLNEQHFLFATDRNRPEIFADTLLDGGILEFFANHWRGVRPFDTRLNEAAQFSVCQGLIEGQPAFAIVGTPEQLHPYLTRFGVRSAWDDDEETPHLLVLRRKPDFNFEWRYETRLPDENYNDLQLCRVAQEQILIGGTRQHNSDTWVWVYSIRPGRVTHESFEVRGRAALETVSVGASDGRVYLGGLCDFYQAQTGSMSHSNGCLWTLTPELKPEEKKIFSGKRSTRVTSIFETEIDGRRTLLVGGRTDAPSTHDGERHSRAFLHLVTQSESHPVFIGGNE